MSVPSHVSQGSKMDTLPNKSEIEAKAMALVLAPWKYDWVRGVGMGAMNPQTMKPNNLSNKMIA